MNADQLNISERTWDSLKRMGEVKQSLRTEAARLELGDAGERIAFDRIVAAELLIRQAEQTIIRAEQIIASVPEFLKPAATHT